MERIDFLKDSRAIHSSQFQESSAARASASGSTARRSHRENQAVDQCNIVLVTRLRGFIHSHASYRICEDNSAKKLNLTDPGTIVYRLFRIKAIGYYIRISLLFRWNIDRSVYHMASRGFPRKRGLGKVLDLKTSNTIDYLIVGQGLAGSILAWLLEQHRQEVVIVDNATQLSASKIAAGIVNPVSGQRLVKHPRAGICLARARAFYANLEGFFNQAFYFERPMIRLFKSEKEQKTFLERKTEPAYSPYIGDSFQERQVWPVPANRFGGFHQKNCGYLNTRQFLDTMRMHFRSRNRLFETEFSWMQISPKQAEIVWNGRRVGHVISCEGFRAGGNPCFSWLPFQLSKGEIVTMESTGDLPETIINQGKWLLPLTRQVFKCGATYEWQSLNTRPSIAARALLYSTARELLIQNIEFNVIAQEAGLRSGSLDKNPIAGIHPAIPALGIFSGFGSRGVLTIPYYAEHFVEHLLHKTVLPKEIDVARYLAYYETGRTCP
ncbi:MAG: NAD(P)/FAD-dependent oxidoreductase [Methylococcales bacterium]